MTKTEDGGPITLDDIMGFKPAQLPPRVVIYGTPGIGKSTNASEWPNPICLAIEKGVDQIVGLKRWPFRGEITYKAVLDAMRWLYQNEHPFQTLVIDSLDWFEPMVEAETLERYNAQEGKKLTHIEDIGYGKGYLMCDNVWEEFRAALDKLRENKNFAIVLVGHSEIKRTNLPDSEAYDRYVPKLQKRAVKIFLEYSDLIVFMDQRRSMVPAAKDGKGEVTRVRAEGFGQVVGYTRERPAMQAKNRFGDFGMPDELSMVKGRMFADLAKFIPYYNPELLKNA